MSAAASADGPGRPLLAALWMSGAVVCLTAMAVAGRVLAAELDTFELMTWRSLIGLAVVVAVAAATGRLSAIRVRRMRLHLARNVAHFAGQNLWFWALTAIPLAQVFALEFTSPIWVALLAPLVLGERLTRARALAAGLGFLGVVLVAQPWVAPPSAGIAAAALAALGFAGSALCTKLLTRTESLASILFWLTAMQAGMGLAITMSDGAMAVPSPALLPWTILVALAGLLAHLSLTAALSLAPASVVMPIDFARLPLAVILGALLYGEAIGPLVAIGATTIVAANWVGLLAAGRARRARPVSLR